MVGWSLGCIQRCLRSKVREGTLARCKSIMFVLERSCFVYLSTGGLRVKQDLVGVPHWDGPEGEGDLLHAGHLALYEVFVSIRSWAVLAHIHGIHIVGIWQIYCKRIICMYFSGLMYFEQGFDVFHAPLMYLVRY